MRSFPDLQMWPYNLAKRKELLDEEPSLMKASLLRSALIISLICAITAPGATAAKVKVWRHYEPGDYEQATLQQTVVSDRGVVRLSRRLRIFAPVKASHVWDLIEDKFGNVYAATGGRGEIFKIAANGKVSTVYTSADSQVLSLASGPDGVIYAGTGASGAIIRIPPQGNPSVLVDRLDSYVWSLAVDKKTGRIFAGTGPHGSIYEVTPQGKAVVFYKTNQRHILCLTQDHKRVLYAGTDKNGLVYRISPQGKGFVIYNAPQSEVHGLLATAKRIYAGTSSPTGATKSPPTVAAGAGLKLEQNSGPAAGNNIHGKGVAAVPVSQRSFAGEEDDGESKGKPAPSLPPPKAGENCLYQIAPDGTVRELFREKAMILSLLRRSDNLLVGTGMKGRLFEIDERTKERVQLARLDHGQIHCLLQRRDGSVLIGAGDPGQVYVLENSFAEQGAVVSAVLDAKILSRWGAAVWRAQTPPGTSVTLAFRSGNVSVPDKTWSNWSAELTNSDCARIASPPARFLQYRITMTTTNPHVTPVLESVTLRYATTNHAPEVSSIEVPDLDGADLTKHKKLKIQWKAVDPNEDELSYSVFARKDGWRNWICVRQNLSKTEFEWDAGTMPPGIYQVKIVASDHADNTKKDALTANRISTAFPITHLPPKVTVKVAAKDRSKAFVQATAVDSLVRIVKASYSINGKGWENLFPQDGIFDSKREDFRFALDVKTAGSHVIVVRVQNAAGNVGYADTVLTIPEKDDFLPD